MFVVEDVTDRAVVQIIAQVDAVTRDDCGTVRGIVVDAAIVVALRQRETLWREDTTKYAIEPRH